MPYGELMRLSGYLVPGESAAAPTETYGAAPLADLTDDERDELLEYLAWYRARRRTERGGAAGPPAPENTYRVSETGVRTRCR